MTIEGALDDAAAADLWSICDRLIGASPAGLQLDLTSVTRVTAKGVQAVCRCLAAGRRLANGIDVVVESAAGRRALLDSMAQV